MTHFTLPGKFPYKRILPVLFWLSIWQLGSMAIEQEILLASPASVIRALGRMAGTSLFWQSIASSFGRIGMGFLLAMILSFLFCAASYHLSWLRELLHPLMVVI